MAKVSGQISGAVSCGPARSIRQRWQALQQDAAERQGAAASEGQGYDNNSDAAECSRAAVAGDKVPRSKTSDKQHQMSAWVIIGSDSSRAAE